MSEICGYIILRKPSENYDVTGRCGWLSKPPSIGSTFYSGIDRMPWFDIDEDYYDGILDEDLAAMRAKVMDNNGFSEINLLKVYEEVEYMLDHSNKTSKRNEINVVYSKKLAAVQGVISVYKAIDWYGIDIYCPGYGSLIRSGVFTKPELFGSYIEKLNSNYLFDGNDGGIIDSYIRDYMSATIEHNLEDIEEVSNSIDQIRIGRISG